MGVYRPNPTVETVDGTTEVKNVGTIKVSNGDLSVAGRTATVDTSGSGSATLTRYMIGYGSATNQLTGNVDFIFEEDAGAGPKMVLRGDSPKFVMEDDTQADDYETMFQQSGASLYMLGTKNDADSKEFIRLAHSVTEPAIYLNNDQEDMDVTIHGSGLTDLVDCDAGDFAVGIGGGHKTGYALTVNSKVADKDTIIYGTSVNDYMHWNAGLNQLEIRRQSAGVSLKLFSGADGASASPVIEFYARGASDDADDLGKLMFTGRNSTDTATVTYATIDAEIEESSSPYNGTIRVRLSSEDAATTPSIIWYWNYNQSIFNYDYEDIDFNIRDASNKTILHTDANGSFVSIHKAMTQYSSSTTIHVNYLYDGFINANMSDAADKTLTLPTAIKGMSFAVQNYGTVPVEITPNGSERINNAGGAYDKLDTQYSMALFFCYSDGFWSAAVTKDVT